MIARTMLAVALVAFAVTPTSADDKLKVPNLVGKTLEDARSAANAAGFPQDLDVETAGPDCKGTVNEKGKVKCQSPAAGTALGRYEHITVYVFRPHEKKRITENDTHDLLYMPIDEALKRLAILGYVGKISYEESDKCNVKTVCGVKPVEFWEDDPITLVVKTKEKVDIAPPP